jgi:hypothetical protein
MSHPLIAGFETRREIAYEKSHDGSAREEGDMVRALQHDRDTIECRDKVSVSSVRVEKSDAEDAATTASRQSAC